MPEVTRLRDLKVVVRDCIYLDPKIIQIEEGHNPRNYDLPENRAHLDQLKANIRENGTRSPLWVRYDVATKKAILVDGECRLRANLELIAEGVEIDSVPTIQVNGGNEAERLLLAITGNTGKPLSKWESGVAFLRFRNFGWSDEKIAQKTGFNVRYVSESIELADAPEEVKHMLSTQAVTPSLALQELRTNGTGAVERLREKAHAAQASGKKTAKREKANLVPNPTLLLKRISEVVGSVEDDLFDSEFKFVEVDRVKLLRLAELVGIKKQKGE